MSSQTIDEILDSIVDYCTECTTCEASHGFLEDNEVDDFYLCGKCKNEFSEDDLVDDERCPNCDTKRWLKLHSRCKCEEDIYPEHMKYHGSPPPEFKEFMNDPNISITERMKYGYVYVPRRYFRCQNCFIDVTRE
jgi:DNA-directed RNA polymerase subunit RPC12/RpoP